MQVVGGQELHFCSCAASDPIRLSNGGWPHHMCFPGDSQSKTASTNCVVYLLYAEHTDLESDLKMPFLQTFAICVLRL